MKKRALCICLAAMMTAVPVYASELSINVNGTVITTDTPAEIKDGVVFVPVSFISGELGAEVKWEDQKAVITLDETSCVYVPGSTTAYKNGAEMTLDWAPYISSDRTMVPLDSLDELLDCFTLYEASSGNINIVSLQKSSDLSSPPEILLKNHNANFVAIPVSWNGTEYDDSVRAAISGKDEFTTNIFRPSINELFRFCFNGSVPDKVSVSMQYLTDDPEISSITETVPVFKDDMYFEFLNQPIPDTSSEYCSRIYVIEAAWGENVCKYAFLTDNKFIYSAYEDLEQTVKDAHAMGYCVIGNYIYYAVLGDEEGFHRMLLDGTEDKRLCDFSGITSSINGSTSIKLTPYGDNSLLCAIQRMQEYDENGKLNGPFPIDYYKINLSDNTVEPIPAP